MNAEQPIKVAILKWLRNAGAWAQNVQSGELFPETEDGETYRVNLADAGTPDIIGWIKGHPFAIEVKASDAVRQAWERQYEKYLRTGECKPSWKRSIEQHMQMDEIEKAGGTVLVCVSVEEVESDFQQLKWL